LSNKEIALQRAVDEVTVRDQLSRIYGKLDVGNRVAALAKLRRLGWRPRQ
jgi:DNA-binding NarL/FixJ family response regulator